MTQQENMLKEAQDYVNALVSQRDFHQNECTKFIAATFKAKRENEELTLELSKLSAERAALEKELHDTKLKLLHDHDDA